MDTIGWIILAAAWVVILASFFYVIRPVLQELYDRGRGQTPPPPKKFFHPDDTDFPHLEATIKECSEMVVVGVSLASFPERYKDILEKRMRSKDAFRLTGFIPDPEFVEKIDTATERELEEYWQVEKASLLTDLNETVKLFGDLSTLAQRNGNAHKVALWGVGTFPRLGVAIVNPDKADAMVRGTPYSTYSPDIVHPVFLIADANGAESTFQHYCTYKAWLEAGLPRRII